MLELPLGRYELMPTVSESLSMWCTDCGRELLETFTAADLRDLDSRALQHEADSHS